MLSGSIEVIQVARNTRTKSMAPACSILFHRPHSLKFKGHGMKGERRTDASVSPVVRRMDQSESQQLPEKIGTDRNNQIQHSTELANRPYGNSANSAPSQVSKNILSASGKATSPKNISRQNSDDRILEDGQASVSRRRSRSSAGLNTVTTTNAVESSSTTDAVTSRNEMRRSGPQHEVDETLSSHTPLDNPTFSTTPLEAELEVALLTKQNKQVLLSRLLEVAPHGKLSMINLCRRGIGVEEAILVREAVIRNPELSVLKLSYNNLGDDGAAVIASALVGDQGHHHLSVLELGFNGIGDVGCGHLAVHCLAGNAFLQTLYLTGNQIGEKGALSIAGAILHGTNLQSLYISANNIGPMGVKTIAGAIAKNEAKSLASRTINNQHRRTIEVLDCASCAMESSGFIAIPGMLLSNTSLKSLCISNNDLNDQDMMLLSQALTQNKSVPLETLSLSFNQITCVGVEYLMNAVWGSRTLQHIKLDNNNIQDRGAQLCAVVLTSISLKTLDLSFNKVSAVGIKALMKNISENNSLETLGLSGIPIDQNVSKAVSYALAYNASLKTLYLDNCSTGFASQRHIVAGAVSNRRSSLRVLTGFLISPVAMTLGMPRLPQEWSNDQVLGFFRLMWQQWLLKSKQGNSNCNSDDESFRGPAPPAAVAAASKIAFTALGTQPCRRLFRTEQHEKPMSERPPVEPVRCALLERSTSGTVRIPFFTVSSAVGLSDFVDGECKEAAVNNSASAPKLATVRSPLDNPQRRDRNLQWLRLHFRALNDIGRLPYNNADLWQLHQYFFSPATHDTEVDMQSSESETESKLYPDSHKNVSVETQPCFLTGSGNSTVNRAVSFMSLNDSALFGMNTNDLKSHKRRSQGAPEDGNKHAHKRAKNFKPRIAYYPRIMSKIQSLGTRPTSDTLSLLRQLKYTESILFGDRDPYVEHADIPPNAPSHSDVDMILLDLL